MYSDQPPMEGPSEPYYPQTYDYNHSPYHLGYSTSPNSPPIFSGIPSPASRHPPHGPLYPPTMTPNGYSAPEYNQQRIEMNWQSYAHSPPFPHHNPQMSRVKRGRSSYHHNAPNGRQARSFRRVHHPVFSHSHEPTEVASQRSELRTEHSEEIIPDQHHETGHPGSSIQVLPEFPVKTPEHLPNPPPVEATIPVTIQDQTDPNIHPQSLINPTSKSVTNSLWCISAVKRDPVSAFPVHHLFIVILMPKFLIS
jgi:hypothetical protein